MTNSIPSKLELCKYVEQYSDINDQLRNEPLLYILLLHVTLGPTLYAFIKSEKSPPINNNTIETWRPYYHNSNGVEIILPKDELIWLEIYDVKAGDIHQFEMHISHTYI